MDIWNKIKSINNYKIESEDTFNIYTKKILQGEVCQFLKILKFYKFIVF